MPEGVAHVRMLVCAAALVAFGLVVPSGVSWPATYPLTGAAVEPRDASAALRQPSILLTVGRTLLTLQRNLNRAIGTHLQAIRDGDSPWAMVVGLAFAFLYGVLHALGPGHGKVVVVSYFLARDARLWRGLLMGGQIAGTHVLSAVVLFWLADLSLKTVLGDSAGAVRDVQLVSYGATAAVAALMLARAVQRARRRRDGRVSDQMCHHGHGPETGHLSLLALCVGLVPCTGAVVIMLFALANDMLVTGTVMVVAIAAGMAVTMSALGVIGILTRGAVVSRWAARGHAPSLATLALEVGGALVILLLSSVLFVGSLWA
jgi:ABC-type nickel/cobalt efflux system permease component RcnA